MLNFYNSHLLKRVEGFHFPFTYAFLTFCTSALGAFLLACKTRTPIAFSEARKHARSLFALALVKCAASALSMMALSRIELSIYKVLLLTGPCFIVAYSALEAKLSRDFGKADEL